jgi:cytochrome o ubiquinol oxidase subunit 3
MTNSVSIAHESHHAAHHNEELYDKTLFGFWTYLMTDCVLFATFFATYAVLHNNTAGGPSSKDLFDLSFALKETIILLTSSFTCGLAMLSIHRLEKVKAMVFFGVTFLLGIAFLTMELTEFSHLVEQGNSWQRSAFLSSYFTLVGCHGLHITCGLLWILVMLGQVLLLGITPSTRRRFACLSLFWHFLDVVWVLIFTIVYLMGVK